MAVTPVNAFTPTTSTVMSVTSSSSRLALPGSGYQTVLLINHGPYPIRFLLGSSSVTVTLATGQTLMPGDQYYVGVGGNTYIAAITMGGGPFNCELNISTGA